MARYPAGPAGYAEWTGNVWRFGRAGAPAAAWTGAAARTSPDDPAGPPPFEARLTPPSVCRRRCVVPCRPELGRTCREGVVPPARPDGRGAVTRPAADLPAARTVRRSRRGHRSPRPTGYQRA